MTDKLLVTAREAAEILSIGISQVRILVDNGQLERRYIGSGTREYRIAVESLKDYVAGLPREAVRP